MTWKQKFLLIGIGLLGALGLLELKARADYNVTQGSGTVIFAFTCFTSKVCPAHVNINSAGTEIFDATTPGYIRAASGAIADGADVVAGAVADAAASAGGTGTISAKLRRVTSQLDTISTNTAGAIPAGTNAIGTVRPTFGAAQLSVPSGGVSIASSGDNTAITRSVGTIKVYGLLLSCASTLTTVTIKNGAGTTLAPLSNVTNIFLPIQAEPYFTTTSTNNFVINLSSAVQCGGTVWYLDN